MPFIYLLDMSLIYLKPLGGLGNRLRTILAGLQLAQKTCRRLTIIWERKAELNAAYQQLFQPHPAFGVIETEALRWPRLREWVRRDGFYSFRPQPFFPGQWWPGNRCFPEALYNDDFLPLAQALYQKGLDQDYATFREALWQSIDQQLGARLHSSQMLYLSTFYEFMPGVEAIGHFVPQPDIWQAVQETVGGQASLVGLHIRRGDHQQARQYSPLKGFIEKMAQEISQNPGVVFYLATDEAAIAQQLARQYKEQLITRFRIRPRHQTAGIKEALIDLYCLAQAQRVYGSYFSSFSEMAARLGQIPEIKVGRKGP
ncbi:MAG: hypothetical protein HC913_17230 [Microscillaceae bacterium]|nr:hypothetical protein [Microscillaceae bacterium]